MKQKLPDTRGRHLKTFNVQRKVLANEVMKAYKRTGIKHFITTKELTLIYAKFRGMCSSCGIKFNDQSKPRFEFFKPLKAGGEVSVENVIVVCKRCKETYCPPVYSINRIPGVDTFPDLVERLVIETYTLEKLNLIDHPKEYENSKDIIRRLKGEMNTALTEIGDRLNYRPYRNRLDYKPKMFKEDMNTVADTIEKMAKDAIEEKPLEEHTKEIDDSMEHIVKQHKYRILR